MNEEGLYDTDFDNERISHAVPTNSEKPCLIKGLDKEMINNSPAKQGNNESGSSSGSASENNRLLTRGEVDQIYETEENEGNPFEDPCADY